jgi:hypothetical protein
MKVPKFVLNKTNFDNYKSCDLYTKLFLEVSGLRKIEVLNYAPTSIVQHIEQNATTLKTFVDLCKWKNYNVWVIQKTVCYHIGTDVPTHIIDNDKVIPWSGQEYSSHYHVTHPLYALSHYKLDDLKQIANKLNIPISKTKKQIYSDIESFIKID